MGRGGGGWGVGLESHFCHTWKSNVETIAEQCSPFNANMECPLFFVLKFTIV